MIRKLQETALWLILFLILLPSPAHSQPARITAPAWWLQEVKMVSEYYGVNPNFALAVAETESSCRGQQFRFGSMGKGTYFGPFGIHKCFRAKWDIADPYINTVIGIRALARYRDKRRTLRKYNAAFNEAYWRRVCYLERRNREAGVFK
ncbi:MAG: hypothetical protein WCA44_11510 [Acidobacteriaceae bacterium]